MTLSGIHHVGTDLILNMLQYQEHYMPFITVKIVWLELFLVIAVLSLDLLHWLLMRSYSVCECPLISYSYESAASKELSPVKCLQFSFMSCLSPLKVTHWTITFKASHWLGLPLFQFLIILFLLTFFIRIWCSEYSTVFIMLLLFRKRQLMLEEQLKEAAREPKQVTTDDKYACSPPICLMAVLPARAYLKFVSCFTDFLWYFDEVDFSFLNILNVCCWLSTILVRVLWTSSPC